MDQKIYRIRDLRASKSLIRSYLRNKAPTGYQLGGSKDGEATGIRKDGKGHPPSPVHEDSRSQKPHGHVPGVTNPDGTPWLPIYYRTKQFMINRETNLFTWNDLIIIKHNAPLPYPSGKIVVVCGMEQVKSEKLSNEFNIHIGDWLYTIEFGDGSSIEIPESYLEKYIETENIDENKN